MNIKKIKAALFAFAVLAFSPTSLWASNDWTTVNTKDDIINSLKADGITAGTIVWLRKPHFIYDGYSRISGLTKLIILDANILPESRNTPKSKKQLIITAQEDSGKEIQLILSNSIHYFPGENGTALRSFYLTSPKKTAKWGKPTLTAIKEGNVIIGMTPEQVLVSWGAPSNTNTTVGSWGKHEQWIYDEAPYSKTYLYIKNGRLTGWQD